MPTYSPQVCHTGSGVCDSQILLSLLKQTDKMPSLEVCPGAPRLKFSEQILLMSHWYGNTWDLQSVVLYQAATTSCFL